MIHGACRNTRHVSLTANAVLALKPAHGLLEKIWHDCVSECIDENTPTDRGVRDFGHLMLYLVGVKPRSKFIHIYQICTTPARSDCGRETEKDSVYESLLSNITKIVHFKDSVNSPMPNERG